MTFPDDDRLLSFGADAFGDFDRVQAEATLISPQGDLYRNHLIVAFWLTRWATTVRTDPSSIEGADFEAALREVAAHLRDGQLLPGAELYEQTRERTIGTSREW